MSDRDSRVERTRFVYCPHDASRLSLSNVAEQPSLPTCPACGFIDYGNPKPCVGALIVRDGRLLLGKRAAAPSEGAWDILGGFIDSGESAEEALRREIMEETGLELKSCRFLGSFVDSYGDWGDWTLNFYFIVEADGDDPSPASDVAELRWFAPGEIPKRLAFPHQDDVIVCWLRASCTA